MSELPTLLPYPDIPNIDDCPDIYGLYCYVVRSYSPGVAAIIKLDNNDIAIVVGDWFGNKILPSHELWPQARWFLEKNAYNLANVMHPLGIAQAQFFVSISDLLVDVQLSINKFVGPGMLRDLFSNTTDVQESIGAKILDDNVIKELKNGNGFVAKPTRYRWINDKPLYARI